MPRWNVGTPRVILEAAKNARAILRHAVQPTSLGPARPMRRTNDRGMQMMATPRSLSNRLRQHSRRSGFTVGVSMALAIAICIAGFVTIYVQLQPYISDFITQDPPEEEARVVAAPDPTEPPADDAESEEEPAPTEEPSQDEEEAASDEEEAPPEEEEEEEPAPTEESEGFDPDLQSNPNASINLRTEPSTAQGNATIIFAIPPQTPLESTGETAAADNPAEDGDTWVEVEIEDGTTGWLREIDTEPFQD
jgi:cytoskeletal protein RodZ